nr:hypothetical protein [uncultured Desulfosarcina sp.]
MVTEHDFLFYGVIELNGFTIGTMQYAKWVKGFCSYVFLFQEIICPGLLVEVNRKLQMTGIANPAFHGERSIYNIACKFL